MIPVTDIIAKMKADNEAKASTLKSQWYFVRMSPEDFKTLFLEACRKELLSRNQDKEFVIDEYNKHIMNQLYYYLSGSDKFEGDHHRGIFLAGSIGSGKTIIMNAFCTIIEAYTDRVFYRTHAKRLPSLIGSHEDGYFDKRPMFIDDIGREPKEVNNYGTKELPTVDLMSIRYDYGSLTFATTNFNDDVLKQFYGEAIVDRFHEMFNYLIMKGPSKRK